MLAPVHCLYGVFTQFGGSASFGWAFERFGAGLRIGIPVVLFSLLLGMGVIFIGGRGGRVHVEVNLSTGSSTSNSVEMCIFIRS